MSLTCRETNEALHQRGIEVFSSFLDTESAIPYKIATEDDEKPVIPDADVFRRDDFSTTKKEPSGVLPTVADCAVHLEFLQTLFVLRERIFRSDDIDKAMGIELKRETKRGRRGQTKVLKDETFEARRREKWPKYIEFAVIRFLNWQESLPKDTGPAIELPPIDILMVWHAFLLNPLLFHTHCRDKPLYNIPFPWDDIHACIDNNDWSFQPPDHDESSDTSDLYQLLSQWSSYLDPIRPKYYDVSPLFASAFSLSSLPSDKSLSALSNSLEDGESSSSLNNPILYHASLVKSIRRTTRYLPPLAPSPPKPKGTVAPAGSTLNSTARSSTSGPGRRPTLAEELLDAVLRQNAFIDKMSRHLWIRSPALQGTLRRSIDRYSKFLKLLRLDNKIPGRSGDIKKLMLVPTLDIDLAWHTHQCSGGQQYMTATKTLVGRFINHDDKIGDDDLSDGSRETRRSWRLLFATEYQICGCWDCEMLMNEVEVAVANAGDEGVNMKNIGAKVEKIVTYHRAVEAARRTGKGMPKKLELQ